MTWNIVAVYEDGVLRPKEPLMLTEGIEVHVSVTPVEEESDPLAAVIGIGEGALDGSEEHDRYVTGKPGA